MIKTMASGRSPPMPNSVTALTTSATHISTSSGAKAARPHRRPFPVP